MFALVANAQGATAGVTTSNHARKLVQLGYVKSVIETRRGRTFEFVAPAQRTRGFLEPSLKARRSAERMAVGRNRVAAKLMPQYTRDRAVAAAVCVEPRKRASVVGLPGISAMLEKKLDRA